MHVLMVSASIVHQRLESLEVLSDFEFSRVLVSETSSRCSLSSFRPRLAPPARWCSTEAAASAFYETSIQWIEQERSIHWVLCKMPSLMLCGSLAAANYIFVLRFPGALQACALVKASDLRAPLPGIPPPIQPVLWGTSMKAWAMHFHRVTLSAASYKTCRIYVLGKHD